MNFNSDLDHRVRPGELLGEVDLERLRPVADGDHLRHEDTLVAPGREADGVEVVLGPRRLKPVDLAYCSHVVGRMAADDERGP